MKCTGTHTRATGVGCPATPTWRIAWITPDGHTLAALACGQHLNQVAARHVNDAGDDPMLALTPLPA